MLTLFRNDVEKQGPQDVLGYGLERKDESCAEVFIL